MVRVRIGGREANARGRDEAQKHTACHLTSNLGFCTLHAACSARTHETSSTHNQASKLGLRAVKACQVQQTERPWIDL